MCNNAPIWHLFKREKEENVEEIWNPPTEFYFNIEGFDIVCLEYDHKKNEMEICYILNSHDEFLSSKCTFNTYKEHLERLKKKISNDLIKN